MAEYLINDTTLTGIANAIREKEGSSESIPTSDFAARIGAIKTGTDPSEWVLTLADGSTAIGITNVLRMNTFANEVMKIVDSDGIVQWECGWPSVDNALEFASASAFTINVTKPGWDGTMEYCNGNGWATWDGGEISSSGTDSRQCIYIRGTGNTKIAGGYGYKWGLTGTNIECNGNIENLLDYVTVRVGEHPDMATYCYAYMFYGCTSLTTAPSLPATTLTPYCYDDMFRGCTSLTTAPSLPATTLAERCYAYMFYGCTSLTTAPSLPATTLTPYCYSDMFYGCTSLTTAPSLPATTLAERCYDNMFYHCTSLTTAPSLPATTLTPYCYVSMFRGCTSLTTAPSLPATTLAERCYTYMFYGCTSLTTAPSLPVTTLTPYCYSNMFYGCTSLTTVPSLPATTLPDYCYNKMFDGCTMIKLSATETDTYTTPYRIPTSGTLEELEGYALANMFANTGGTFTGTPTFQKTYYLDSSNTIV